MRLHRTYIINISVFLVFHFGQLIGCIVIRSVSEAVEFCGTRDDIGMDEDSRERDICADDAEASNLSGQY